MKTVIEMAREAGFSLYRDISAVDGSIANLKRFTELVAAAERNRVWTQENWAEYEHGIAAVEREACAKVCDELSNWYTPKACATLIRARGNT